MEIIMRNTVLAAILAALSVSAVAEAPADVAVKPTRFYVEYGLNSGSGETEFSGDRTVSYDMDTRMSALTFGYIARTGVRFELALTSIDASLESADNDDEFSGFDLNGKFPLGKDTIRPYLGAGMGFYDWENTAALFADGEDLSGVSLNLMAGVLFEVHPHIELELGAQYKAISWETIQASDSRTEVEISSSFLGVQAAAKVKF